MESFPPKDHLSLLDSKHTMAAETLSMLARVEMSLTIHMGNQIMHSSSMTEFVNISLKILNNFSTHFC